MKTELLQQLLMIELRCADQLIETLPAPLKHRCRQIETTCIEVVHGAIESYLQNASSDTNKQTKNGNLENISIE